jgi:hypothetical protein
MGNCTSTTKRRKKQQPHNRVASNSSIALDIKQPPPLPPLPLSAFPNHQYPQPYSIVNQFSPLPSPPLSLSVKPVFHRTDTNSLIQLYSSPTDNYDNNHSSSRMIHWMSSSTSIPANPPLRIPILKTRLPAYHTPQTQQASVSTVASSSKHATSAAITNKPTGMTET